MTSLRQMKLSRLLPLVLSTYLLSCGGGSSSTVGGGGGTPFGAPVNGVLQWKNDLSGAGNYSHETSLTTANVNPTQFGRLGSFQSDGLLVAQPLYISGLDMPQGIRNVVILATEHDSVYAIDADNPGGPTLWERHYVDTGAGITTLPDIFGGRSQFDGEVGITGTPVVDQATGALYFVTTLARNGVAEQWLRSVDVRTGQDVGAGSVKIQASVAGDGKGSVNGQIPFDPSVENQRSGLVKWKNSILVVWGSFSDYGVYHGWLMAFDPKTLSRQAVFNPTIQDQPDDPAGGPADHGGGGSFWQGGASPTIDTDGNIYLDAADGSFNANSGGNNYGDTLLKLQLNGSSFQIVDWFTPFNQACVDVADLELGSGGVTLLPSDITDGSKLAASYSKEGRMFLVNRDTLGHYNSSGDNQIPQEFMVGDKTCTDGMGGGEAEGPDWNRLYGNPAYWNGNLYAGASNMALKQYKFAGGLVNPTPVAVSPSAYGLRGGNVVVSSNGNTNGVAWVYEKAASGQGILHAYDANSISTELWNSNMNSGRDALGEGVAFNAPVVASGRVIVTYDHRVGVFGLL